MTMTDLSSQRQSSPKPRRPRVVYAFGALAIVIFLIGLAGGSYQGKLADVQKNDNSSFLPGSADSTKVANESEKFNSIVSIPGFVVYQRDGGLTASDKQKIAADIAKFRQIKGVAADEIGRPQYSTKSNAVATVGVPLIGRDNGKPVNGPALVDAEKAVLKAARDGAPGGLVIHSAGAGGVLVAFIDAFSGLDGSLLISAGLVVIIILLFVYRSPVLWFFPLFSAGLALGAAALVIYPLAKHGVITLNGQSQGILSVLVIGAGTDYALLLISRYREELHEYQSRVAAMIAAMKGAAPPILASATTVILGLICLTIADLNSTAGLGPVCAIGIACTVVVMLTVLPALLVISGRWIFWPKRPRLDHQTDIMTTHGVWGRFSRGLTAHSRRNWAVSGVLLLACVAAIVGLKTQGLSTVDGFTTKPDAIVGQGIYDANFNKGAGAPAEILANVAKVDDVRAAAMKVKGIDDQQVCVATDFGKLAAAAKAGGGTIPAGSFDANGCAAPALQVTPQGGKTIVNATLTSSYDSSAAYDTVRRLRVALHDVSGADALVGGQSAVNLDVQDASRHDRNVIIPLVLLVILLVLGVVLRALIAPIILIGTVVLSFTAALGVSALFFNHVFHFKNADPAFPLFAFVFLVALGIDYNIFLMTRVREETVEHGTKEGIVRGLAVTGGVITSAGLVLAATFVVLGVLPIVFLAELGFTVAFGVLLDTIVVRSILVPALSHDIGKKIWWPSKLAGAGARD
ncbi:MAG TPA: MMPL family transporter [Jatrophihabitans sp.]|jgi:RND superfamily putative drug exporter|uniref:MMPL family transporter n=1 Tax=Jatrophihabitans sp. TaxID=1932789 RepID=UPI002E04D779|nr:MMPL family transporter [Jatrophihabitans sp.]